MLISLIIPTLNEEKYLSKLLKSLTCQTNKSFEVIVVDGSSEDKTVKIAESFFKILPNLKVIKNGTRGLSAQRNIGAKSATGKYLFFTDADSVLINEFIDMISNYLIKNQPDFVTALCLPDGNSFRDKFITILINSGTILSSISKHPVALGPMAIVSKKAFFKVGGFNHHHKYAEDLEFSWKMNKNGFKLHLILKPLYYFSLRRYRRFGYFKTYIGYCEDMIKSLLTGKIIKDKPGYTMGGQNYI